LDPADEVDAFLLAALCGVLHGPTTGFLSQSMSNVYSRGRLAARQAAIADRQRFPRRATFGLLEAKVDRVLADGSPTVRGQSLHGDARTFGTRLLPALQDRCWPPAQLVVTSPPYLGVLRYGLHNWMRLWLIGVDARVVDLALDAPTPAGFAPFMHAVLADLQCSLARDGVVALALGTIKRVRGRDIGPQDLAWVTWSEAAEPAGYKLVGVICDRVEPVRKVSKMWGSLAGDAGANDTILVLSVSEAGRRRAISALGRPLRWPTRSSIQRRASSSR
jgi:site-specific DNA-methyltransferase (adenine-specific)